MVMRILKYLVSFLLLLTLSACNFFAPSPDAQTQVAAHQVAGTQMADLRQTATYEIDRLLITQEAVQTAVQDIELQNTRTAVTMIALGTTFIDAQLITPAAPLTGLEASGATPEQVVVTPGGVAQGANGAVPQAQATQPAATTNPTLASLANIVTTESVGADDCAIAPSTSFASTTPGIYVVATAFNLGPQTTITYRWQREGIEIWVDTWSPRGETNGQCIWYYLTPAEVEMTPGNWSIEILINGAMSGTPVTFTITG
ncbi:MAG: hypothetical protein IH587_12125 [Anaerolineae bacterium]|nr:hypothetical protein [Anaerolineae bacterium]